MLPYFKAGNPSSLHHDGRLAKEAIEEARDNVASLIGCLASEVTFTSGGTESNNTIFESLSFFKNTAISSIEHPSVLAAAERFSKRGGDLNKIPVDSSGVVNIDFLEDILKRSKTPSLVSIIWANNETGVLQPIEKLLEVVKKYDAFIHCDAVAAVGKIPIELSRLKVDMISISAHKIYGPKGVGALYIRKGTPFSSLLLGGNQENKRRAGTENVAGIVGFGEASLLAKESVGLPYLKELTQSLAKKIREEIPGSVFNTPLGMSVPGILNISFPGCSGEEIMINLDLEGVSVSTGAACSSGAVSGSHVLKAMGISEKSIRISLGMDTSKENLEKFMIILKRTLARMSEFEII